MKNNNLLIIITSSIILFCIGSLYLNIKKEKNNKYEKMYKIIELAGDLNNDIYNRKISPQVVLKFCKIAKKYSIDLDNITDEQFNLIYKSYTDYLIKKYE